VQDVKFMFFEGFLYVRVAPEYDYPANGTVGGEGHAVAQADYVFSSKLTLLPMLPVMTFT